MKSAILTLSLISFLWQIVLAQGLKISTEFPQYWEYKGNPTLLLGGSDEDNLFQMPNVETHLDTLAAVGGNYVRCTMSSRDEGNVWAFYRDPVTGLYDLDRWDETYWQRFSDFLRWTAERDIIVQIELWATFDFYRNFWDLNPFNPKNNSSYDGQRTELPDTVATHPVYADNSFFTSIPSHRNNMKLLEYQQKFIDKILSYSLTHSHILYCIDNETSVTAAWGAFWSTYLKKKAAEINKTIYCTEMWDPWDLNHISHRESFDHPELYEFVEISQNNHHTGEKHWRNGLQQIERLKISGNLRPVTNIKIYGADQGRHGGDNQDAMEKFIRAVLFGSSSARFHRPTSGLGLHPIAQRVISAVDAAIQKSSFFEMEPLPLDLLLDKSENEAYIRGKNGREYLVYFTDGGEVRVALEGSWELEWNEVLGDGHSIETMGAKEGLLTLDCPGAGQWLLLLRKA